MFAFMFSMVNIPCNICYFLFAQDYFRLFQVCSMPFSPHCGQRNNFWGLWQGIYSECMPVRFIEDLYWAYLSCILNTISIFLNELVFMRRKKKWTVSIPVKSTLKACNFSPYYGQRNKAVSLRIVIYYFFFKMDCNFSFILWKEANAQNTKTKNKKRRKLL